MNTSCDLCTYLEWRLKDARLSKDKAIEANIKRQLTGLLKQPVEGFYEDVSRTKHTLYHHRLMKHQAA
jgi:hypothetical protein